MELLQFAKSRRGGELIGIIILALGICLSLALLTYHPDDSSAFYTSTNTAVANWIGYYGATIAWLFVSFLGFAGVLFPAALLILGWNRFWGKDLEFLQTKLIGFALLVITAPPLFDLAFGKVWLRGALLPSGGYLGSEIHRAAAANLNGAGAAIVLITIALIGILLATRISLAAVFLALHQQLVALGRAITLQWARFTERRRKEKMKEAIVRKHLEKDAPALRLVEPPAADETTGPVVREVRGPGRFQIRKVTKADLRKAAEELSKQEVPDPAALYPSVAAAAPAAGGRERPPLHEAEPPELLELDDPPVVRAMPPRPKVREPKKPAKREVRLTHELLPPVNLLAAGPKTDGINDEVHKKFLEIGRLIEDRCREFAVEGEVTAYHPGPVVTTFEFKPSAGVKYAKVVNLGDDLALALKAESIRI